MTQASKFCFLNQVNMEEMIEEGQKGRGKKGAKYKVSNARCF